MIVDTDQRINGYSIDRLWIMKGNELLEGKWIDGCVFD